MVEVCLAQLKATPAEPVAIGSGYVLDGVRAWLTAQGYRWQAAKITGPLQELVECAFQAHLAGLGFNVSFDLLTDPNKAGLLWWRQIQWLKGGDVNIISAGSRTGSRLQDRLVHLPDLGLPPLRGGTGPGWPGQTPRPARPQLTGGD